MRSRRLYVCNESTLVADSQVRIMTSVCNIQMRDHAYLAWGLPRIVVEFFSGTLAEAQASTPKGSWVITVMDDPDQAGALGWHWVDDQDHVYGEVFAQPCLDSGSGVFSGNFAISSVLSHEILETYGDPFCNAWSDSGRGFLVATELCDPVEADVYPIRWNDTEVMVSNFVLPEWFDPTQSEGERFDYMGRCTAPFSMTPGGYWIQMPTARESQQFARTVGWEKAVGFDVRDDDMLVFSPEMPEWLRDLKMHRGRNLIKRLLV